MKANIQISIPEQQITAFCRRNHIRRFSLFGSVLRGDFRPDSDVDVLVEFEPGKTPGLAFFGLQDDLSEMLGRRVELYTPDCFGPRMQPKILAQAEMIYNLSGFSRISDVFSPVL